MKNKKVMRNTFFACIEFSFGKNKTI